jgi:hypothetical protein
VQDAPYASSKEQLGGFMLLELPSLDAAVEWAARCPAASYGAVEAPDREVAVARPVRGTASRPRLFAAAIDDESVRRGLSSLQMVQ